jgi:hypothetical protein
MKTIVLDVQKDLFESSVLEQSIPIQFVSLDEALGIEDASCVLLSSKGINDFIITVRKLAHAQYKKGSGLILVNPPVDIDIGNAIDAPVSIFVKKRQASSICKSSGSEFFKSKGEYEIWSDGIIASSLSTGTMAVDDRQETVILKYQPKNTTGAVFVTTLKLLSYSGMTNEEDRESLLKLLLDWENTQSQTIISPTEVVEETIDKSVLDAVAILAFAYKTTDPNKIHSVISRFFTLDCNMATIKKSIDSLTLMMNAPDNELLSKIADYIDQSGLYSYAREIKEILEEEEADT